MDKYQDLNQKIKERIKQKHSEIILGVYQYMVYSHNDFCGCDYCKILKEYVFYKKRACLQNRLINEMEDNDYYDLRPFGNSYEKLSDYKKKYLELKKQKDALKSAFKY